MKSILNRLDKLDDYIISILFPLMLLFVCLSVIFRYFRLGPLPWTDEASRYLMIWVVFAGISSAFKTNSHLGLNFFVDRFFKNKKVFYFIRATLIILFGVFLLYNSFLIIKLQIKYPQFSSTMGIPMWWVYSSLLYGSAMIIIRILQKSFIIIKNNKDNRKGI